MHSDRLRFSDIRRTSAFRLTIRLGAVFAIGVVSLLGLVYAMTARELAARNDVILHEQARRFLSASPAELPTRVRDEIRRNGKGFSYFALISGDGEPIVGNFTVKGRVRPGKPIELPATATRGPIRLLSVRTPQGETILIGRDIGQIAYLRRRILLILTGSGVLMLLSVGGAAILVSLRPLRRIRDLRRAASEIAGGRLDVRMPLSARHDELDQFADTVNLMIAEVEHVVAQVKGVTDAVAHDLRTPLTRVRGALHRAAAVPGAPAALVAITQTATEDLDIVLGRFTALLRIAEIEASARRSGFGAVEIGPLVRGGCDLYEPLIDEAGLTLGCHLADEVGPPIDADEKLMMEVMSNLLDNAAKFARSAVTVRAGRDEAGRFIEVADDGPGIAVSERDAVLRRFYRSPDAARVPGAGLGLSVVVAILHLHGFALTLGDAAPGLRAQIRLPG